MTQNLFSLITYKDLPGLDPDDQLLKASLERRGAHVQALIWDDENVDWSKAGVCVIRSTWDYHLHYQKFCSWLERVSKVTTILNPSSLLLWNSKKTYLKELIAAGLPVIPSVFFTKEYRPKLSSLLEERNWQEIVIKPTVGLASSNVKRVRRDSASLTIGENHLDQLLEKGEVIIQEFLPAVEGYGERALMFIDGKFSHSIRKTAFQHLAVAGKAGEIPVEASSDELSNAAKFLAFLKETPLYARVDLVRDKNDQPLLIEFELLEPSLFLQAKPEAADIFADAMMRRVACLC